MDVSLFLTRNKGITIQQKAKKASQQMRNKHYMFSIMIEKSKDQFKKYIIETKEKSGSEGHFERNCKSLLTDDNKQNTEHEYSGIVETCS